MVERPIFVFGSNEAGIHGAGAALHARQQHGAILGRGVGLQGYSYAIPTKDRRLRTLPLSVIYGYVQDFVHFALDHPSLTFEVTRIGCGLAGYTDADIAPLFRGAPANCRLPAGWANCRSLPAAWPVAAMKISPEAETARAVREDVFAPPNPRLSLGLGRPAGSARLAKTEVEYARGPKRAVFSYGDHSNAQKQ